MPQAFVCGCHLCGHGNLVVYPVYTAAAVGTVLQRASALACREPAGLMVVYWVLESTELHLALKRFSPQQAPCDTFRATMIGQFFNCITPFASGGQPMPGAVSDEKRGGALLCQLFTAD